MVKLMKNKINFKSIIIILIAIIVLVYIYYLLNHIFSNEEESYKYLKNYDVNEYIPTYVSDEDMAKIYLNDYIKNMNYDVEKAYNLLHEEYRNKKFGNPENYKSYVSSLQGKSYKLSTYYKYNKDGYTIFGVTDQNSNLYIFKTIGVMQYSVFLDDYTVEI